MSAQVNNVTSAASSIVPSILTWASQASAVFIGAFAAIMLWQAVNAVTMRDQATKAAIDSNNRALKILHDLKVQELQQKK